MSTRTNIALAALLTIAIAAGITAKKVRDMRHAASRDVTHCIIGYYRELRARLASGDRAAIPELMVRLEFGPMEGIARGYAEYTIEHFAQHWNMSPEEQLEWLRENKERLVFDPQLKMFCLRDGPASRPANERGP